MPDDLVKCSGITNVKCSDSCQHAIPHEAENLGSDGYCIIKGHCSTIGEDVACVPITQDHEEEVNE